MSAELLEWVRRIAGDIFHLEPAQISGSSSPEEIAVWDSVQHLNLVLALEEAFSLQFEPEEMDQMKSIGQIAEMVGRKTGNGR